MCGADIKLEDNKKSVWDNADSLIWQLLSVSNEISDIFKWADYMERLSRHS